LVAIGADRIGVEPGENGRRKIGGRDGIRKKGFNEDTVVVHSAKSDKTNNAQNNRTVARVRHAAGFRAKRCG
jgi:hypothetical protein